MTKRLLLIFAKQARKGKIKTRLARTIGAQKALEIYKFLLEHTAEQASAVEADRWVCYSPEIEEKDAFPTKHFHKTKQAEGDLGQRMLAAFEKGFQASYQSILLVGSDIYELRTDIIEKAFKALEQTDAVFGPAKDGGYYLVGMTKAIPAVFLNKKWSHPKVLEEALAELTRINCTSQLVDELNDVDEEKDLPQELSDKFDV